MSRTRPLHTIIAGLMLAFCAGHAVADNDATLRIITEPSGPLVATAVQHAWTDGGLKISGRIEKRSERRGRILGHVEIDLLDAKDAVIATHSTQLQHYVPNRRNPDWANFYTLLQPAPPGLAGIRVRHALGGS